MKIATFTRTFQDFEEQTILDFLLSHSFSDKIYVGTCQTSKRTRDILSGFANVETREFDGVITMPDGTVAAHESQYYGFLMDWAKETDATWGVWDDADHICNSALQRHARNLLETNNTPFAYALLIYIWGTDFYFPDLNPCCPQERLWAWNIREWMPDLNLEHPTTLEIRNQPDADSIDKLVLPHPPYVVRHYSWLTEEIAWRKIAFNASRGVTQLYPLDSCGQLLPIPAWAY